MSSPTPTRACLLRAGSRSAFAPRSVGLRLPKGPEGSADCCFAFTLSVLAFLALPFVFPYSISPSSLSSSLVHIAFFVGFLSALAFVYQRTEVQLAGCFSCRRVRTFELDPSFSLLEVFVASFAECFVASALENFFAYLPLPLPVLSSLDLARAISRGSLQAGLGISISSDNRGICSTDLLPCLFCIRFAAATSTA